MNLLQLEAFLQIARQTSLVKAAAVLKVSQPTLSLRLRSLESSTGTPLFFRAHAGMRLTPAGERLLPFAERIMQLTHEGLASVRDEFIYSRITVAAVESAGHLLAADLLNDLRARIAGLQASLVTGHSHQVVQRVLDGVSMVGFIATSETYIGLETVPLLSAPIRCFVRAGHPLLDRQPCSAADLAEFPVVLSPWRSRWTEFEGALSAASGGRLKAWDVSPVAAVKRLIDKGWVGFLSQFHAEAESTVQQYAVLVVKDLPAQEFTLSVIFRDRKITEPLVQEFLKLLGQRFPGAADRLRA